MRILFLDEARGFGGSIAAMARYAQPLRRRGLEVHAVLTAVDERSLRALAGFNSVHVLPLPHRNPGVSRRLEELGRRSTWLKRLALAEVVAAETSRRLGWLWRLGSLMQRLRPHVLHANNGPAFNAAALGLAAAMRTPTVVTVRGGSGQTAAARLGRRWADREIFISEHMSSMFTRPRPNSLVLYDGLDLSHYPPPAPRAAGPLRVVHVGMFTPWKGQELFLQAAAEVAARCEGVEFYLCGDAIDPAQRAYADALRRKADENPLKGRVTFLGFRDDIIDALRRMDVLVHSSTEPEPFGLVVLEGMAAGLAVIAANEGGPAEIIRNGVDGLLTPPRDARALAAAIEGLLAEPRRRDALAAAARARAVACFDAERTADELARLYARLGRATGR